MMNKRSSILITFTFIILLLCAVFELGFCREFGIVKNFNGVDDHKSSSSEIESIARFAVEEHNKRENAVLQFERVLKAKEEVVVDGLESRKVNKVPVHDPQIQAAANHLVAAINQRINSEVKYELVEILQAEAEVVEDCLVRYEIDMLLKLKIESGEDKAQI